MTRQALFVGIEQYDRHAPLRCCRKDARAMAKTLEFEDGGRPNWSGRVLVDGASRDVGQDDLVAGVSHLLDSTDQDDVLFYYSGHAFLLGDGDLLLASCEDDPASPDGERSGLRLSELIAHVKRRAARLRSVVVILDCCHAGAAVVDAAFPGDVRNMAVLAASRDDQQAREVGEHGRFTASLLAGLEGDSADIFGNISVVSLFADASESLERRDVTQKPVLKACLEHDIIIKRVSATITEQSLQSLVRTRDPRNGGHVFETSRTVFHPYPDMEAPEPADGGRRSRQGNEHAKDLNEHQRLMETIKKWRDARLIAITDDSGATRDLYWACLNGGSVRLTPRGRYYFDLMKRRMEDF
ncbi:caspase family protein [Bifidobacterium sp. CP2]|uniref:caspase family protein n=1 Tax=Bifidobacterium sp. CP2 TaxID=2809025 RepID=UPI001BDD9B32|nr:caspase family protein [Bifidobacterium sp. CP2]MBT1180768.1 caspase family protein [Bifidobacterium sp. CP2]